VEVFPFEGSHNYRAIGFIAEIMANEEFSHDIFGVFESASGEFITLLPR